MHHDEAIIRAVALARAADMDSLARAWAHSLASRDPSLRGAWGAAVVLRNLPEHPFEPSTLFHPSNCAVCGLREDVDPVTEQELAEDRYVYAVSAVDWAVADLAGAPARATAAGVPEELDASIVERMLEAISALPATAQLTELNACLTGTLKATKHERMRVLEQLGCAGILPVAGHPSYASEWIRWEDANARQPAEFFKREWAYPVRFWTGADGVDRDAARVALG